jgi:hypothetical protein
MRKFLLCKPEFYSLASVEGFDRVAAFLAVVRATALKE